MLSSLSQRQGKKWGNNHELALAWRNHLEGTSDADDVSNHATFIELSFNRFKL
jgi:hypothetical protein